MKQRAPLSRAIVYDGPKSYDKARTRNLYTTINPEIKKIRSLGSNANSLSPKIGRINGTVRDREIVMRGMEMAKSAQEVIDAMRIHYNFIRNNEAVGGQTPAEAAGINLNLNDNKKESLMRQAAIHAKDEIVSPVVKGWAVRI